PLQNRREFLGILAAGAFTQLGAGSSLKTTKLADNFTLISGAGSNVLVVSQPEGVLMVDGGLAEHSAELLKVVAGVSDPAQIQALFNTHWHLDHTGSNETIAKAGAKIIAHENTKLWMGAEIISMW